MIKTDMQELLTALINQRGQSDALINQLRELTVTPLPDPPAVPLVPTLTGPAFLDSSVAVFTWKYNNFDAYKFHLRVGKTRGGDEYFSSGILPDHTVQCKVTTLPVDGSTLFVEFSYKGADGWTDVTSTYTAHTSNHVGWAVDDVSPLPEGFEVIDAHDLGYLHEGWAKSDKQKLAESRISFPIMGVPCYEHTSNKGEIINPVSYDSPFVELNCAKVKRILFRQHICLDAQYPFSGHAGKFHALQVGRGMISWRWGTSQTDIVGTGGGGANTMHPSNGEGDTAGTTNGIRLLASLFDKGQLQEASGRNSKYYGTNIGKGNQLLPVGEWFSVTTIVTKDVGWELFVNGVSFAVGRGMPVKDWDKCKAVWYRHRLMHGGIPSKLAAVRKSVERYGGFFIAVSAT